MRRFVANHSEIQNNSEVNYDDYVDKIFQGQNVTFEIDTVASVSVCSRNFYNKNLLFCKLLPNYFFISS